VPIYVYSVYKVYRYAVFIPVSQYLNSAAVALMDNPNRLESLKVVRSYRYKKLRHNRVEVQMLKLKNRVNFYFDCDLTRML
jgi:hypothetical protein